MGAVTLRARFAALATAMLWLLAVAAVPVRALPVAIVVNTTSDLEFPADGTCSLRAAIKAANGLNAGYCGAGTAEKDGIRFNIGSGVPVITVGSALPQATQPLTISGNTGGATRVRLQGNSGIAIGLDLQGGQIAGAGHTIRALEVVGFAIGINVATTGTAITGSVIQANDTGIRSTVTGLQLGGTTGVTPGGACTGDCNSIVGNRFGASLSGGGTVVGNYVGLTTDGDTKAGNQVGISITGGGTWTVGGATPGAGNVISGNDQGLSTQGCACTIQGNLVGTNSAGTAARGNTVGLNVGGATGLVGGSEAGTGYVVVANVVAGIQVSSPQSGSLRVLGNRIGVTSGGAALGNQGDGLILSAGPYNRGVAVGSTSGGGNLIANNARGVAGQAGVEAIVRGNSIHDNTGKPIALPSPALVAAPVITGTNPVRGTACASCEVDIYSDAGEEAATYHGTVQADASGQWTYSGTVSGPNVTAIAVTATASSEVSAPLALGAAPVATPTPRPAAATPAATQAGQPTAGATKTATAQATASASPSGASAEPSARASARDGDAVGGSASPGTGATTARPDEDTTVEPWVLLLILLLALIVGGGTFWLGRRTRNAAPEPPPPAPPDDDAAAQPGPQTDDTVTDAVDSSESAGDGSSPSSQGTPSGDKA